MITTDKDLSKLVETWGTNHESEQEDYVRGEISKYSTKYCSAELGFRIREVLALERMAECAVRQARAAEKTANSLEWVKKRVEKWEKRHKDPEI